MAMARAPDVPKSKPMYTGAASFCRLSLTFVRELRGAVKGLLCVLRALGQSAGVIRHASCAGGGSDTFSSISDGVQAACDAMTCIVSIQPRRAALASDARHRGKTMHCKIYLSRSALGI